MCVCLTVSAAQYISVFSSFHTVSLQDVYAPVRRIIQSQTNPGRSATTPGKKTKQKKHASCTLVFALMYTQAFFVFPVILLFRLPSLFLLFLFIIFFEAGPGLDAETFFGK